MSAFASFPIPRPRPLTDAEYAQLAPEDLEAAGLSERSQGAPADFGGTVLPNPGHIEAHYDTDPIPATRLPHGVTFQKGNYTGGAKFDLSNPASTEVIPAVAHETRAKFDKPVSTQAIDFSKYEAAPQSGAIDFSKYEKEPSAASPIPPPAVAKPHVEMKPMSTSLGDVALGTDIGTALEETPNPGVSEGRGLREGLAEYDRAGFGSMGQGAVDLAHGKIARGGHEVISGATNAITPIAPFLIPAAPAAAGRAIVGGAAGSYLAGKGAEALHLSPDQQDLAGDVGGLVGGYAGAEAPKIQRGAVRLGARATEDAINSKLNPFKAAANINVPADEATRLRIKVPGRDYGLKIKPAAADVLDATGENKPFAGGMDEYVEKPLDATGENRPFAGERTPPVTVIPRGDAGSIAESVSAPTETPAPVANAPIPRSAAGSIAESVTAPPAASTPASRASLLDQLRQHASRIEGAAPATETAEAPTGRSLRIAGKEVSPNTDLTEALKGSIPKDKYPVKIVYDRQGNMTDLDGRHRVIQAIEEGRETIPVETTLRDGTVETTEVDPKKVAKKFGVTKESLAATDEQQPYRRGRNGKPRAPVTH